MKNEIVEEHHRSFANALIRAATAINSNVKEQSVRKAIQRGPLSWTTVEDQKKVITVGRFLGIEHLDEDQCNKLFDIIDGMIPKGWRWRRKDFVDAMKTMFYEKWLMKCTYTDVYVENDDVLISIMPLSLAQ